MKYHDLAEALRLFNEGCNVSRYLKTQPGLVNDPSGVIEITYDLQAGSYIENRNNQREQFFSYVEEIAHRLSPYVSSGCSLLDAGCGELTITRALLNLFDGFDIDMYATDISLSRLAVGRDDTIAGSASFSEFVSSIEALPLLSSSIDVVYTTHAVEPNGGREMAVVSELFRVAKDMVVLFEPSYEQNTREGRARMDRLGYARGLPQVIERAGGRLLDLVPMVSAEAFLQSPLNPTYAYICEKVDSNKSSIDCHTDRFATPGGEFPLRRLPDCYFSDLALLAFPMVHGIPILRTEASVLASYLSGGSVNRVTQL